MSLTSPIVEFGFGHGPADPNPVWVDCSEFVRAESTPIQRGRTPDSGGIRAGTATIVLENLDGRFDPDNTDGPHYGELTDGTPVRVRVAFGEVTEDVWRGWVEAWPVTDTEGDSVVVLDCLDVVGLLAWGNAPSTAFEALIGSLSPEPSFDVAQRPSQWWNPGPSGWTDRIGGLSARHSGGLSEMDPLVDGDERTWGNDDPDGFAEAHGAGLDDDEASPVAVSAWFRFDPERAVESGTGWTIPNVVVARVDGYVSGLTSTRLPRLFVAVTGDLVSLSATVYPEFENLGRRRFTSSWLTAEEAWLIDGKAHHLFAWMHPISGLAELWLDGRQVAVELTEQSEDAGYDSWVRTPGPLQIGVGDREASVFARTPYLGAIDHVMIWPAFEQDLSVSKRLPVDLFEAGRLAWAGQRLDERLRHIAVAMNVDGLLGDFDVSGITTLQGYRQADVLELLQKIEDTEQGRIWVDRHGKIRYSARPWYWRDTTATTDQAWFSDDPDDLAAGAIGYLSEGLVVSRDPRKTTNVAQVTSEFGRMQTVRDQDSIDIRGERNPIHLSGLLHRSDRQSMTIARWLVQTRSEPKTRIEQLTFHVDDDLAKCVPFACTVEEGWRCKITRKGVDYLAHVIGITHEIGPEGWRVTLFLDSTLAGYTWFRADISETDGPDLVAF